MKQTKDNTVKYGNSEKFSNFVTNGHELCEESYSTRKILKDHLRFMLDMISEKDIKEFVKEAQDLLHTVMCDVLNKNSELKDILYYSYVGIDDLTHVSFENNVQLGEYFKDIESILKKFEYFKDFEIDQHDIYRYIADPPAYKKRKYKDCKNSGLSSLYFALFLCLSMYKEFNSESIHTNFEEDYTLEKNKKLFENFLHPLYFLFKFRVDTDTIK